MKFLASKFNDKHFVSQISAVRTEVCAYMGATPLCAKIFQNPDVSGLLSLHQWKIYLLFIYLFIYLEQFSFECRKVIGFALTTLRDWFKNLTPLFHPIRSKTKTNHDSFSHVLPRFASATCNHFEF